MVTDQVDQQPASGARATQLLRAALGYAARGIAVLPCHTPTTDDAYPCSCGRAGCKNAGKHPRVKHGVSEASTDPAQVRRWWSQWPDANIGVATGKSGWVVLDNDPRHGGDIGLAELVAAHAPPDDGLLDTLIQDSGGGGEHYIFAVTASAPGPSGPNQRSVLRDYPGLDTRVANSYVLVAPSLHASGAFYQWRTRGVEPQPLPDWLHTVMVTPSAQPAPSRASAPLTPHKDHSPRYWLDRALATAYEGNRDETCFWLATMLRDDGLSQSEATAVALDFALQVGGTLPFQEYEARKCVRSAYSRPAREPARARQPAPGRASQPPVNPAPPGRLVAFPDAHWRTPESPGRDAHGGDAGDAGAPPVDAEPGEPEGEPIYATDLGNAQRFVAQHGAVTRFVKTWGYWLTWDGRRWARDLNGEVLRLAKTTARSILREAANATDLKEQETLAKWALRSQSRERLSAMVAETGAASEQAVARLSQQFDTTPWLLNCRNGTLDLRSGTLSPHDPAQNITRLADVDYQPDADCPTWRAFLERIMGGNQELITFIQRAVGYSLTDQTTEQVLFLLHGQGQNGKSTFLDTLMYVVGDYGMGTPTSTLMAKADNSIPNDVARLKGARFVKASETEEGHTLAESLVKQMTGDEMLTARFMRGEWFDFAPTFKLWLAVNHLPRIRGTDDGIWRRIRYIPFEVRISDDEKDDQLRDKLRAEARGILAWAAQGCRGWRAHGLGYPAQMRAANNSYRARMDNIGQFLQAMCEASAQASASAKALYSMYETWCADNGEEPRNPTVFGRYLGDHGYSKEVGRRGNVWHGLRLLGRDELGARAE